MITLSDNIDVTLQYDAVNLRLQYSSYFLFVLVISCVLYGMIKGKPAKQNFKKVPPLSVNTVLSLCTSTQEPIQKTKQYATCSQ